MSVRKDPAIKLFGKAIPLPPPPCDSGGADEDLDFDEALSFKNETATTDNESSSSKSLKNEEEQSDINNSEDKTLKKPDKILPCPRCNSMDTKFCYYNNYNVNQPRHFCKNCQRYWTAGGTMRNVPVGAGRRKNKIPASQYCHVSVSKALQNAPTLGPKGTVLTFGSDKPLGESMKDQIINNCRRNGFHKPENYNVLVTNDDQNGKKGPNNVQIQNFHSYPPQVPFFAGPPWPYLLNMTQWVPQPGVIPSGYPMPFYPAPPYWGFGAPPPWAPLSNSPNSHTLGKHCRDEEGEKSRERSLWMPKTLRIDDLEEAAKSSIWATLGIKPEKCNSSTGGGGKGELFKAFRSKASDSLDTSAVLQANPAALLRSRNFQESS